MICQNSSLGFIGFGEAGQAMAETLRPLLTPAIQSFDLVTERSSTPSVQALVAQCDLVISTVTAGEAANVAQACAEHEGEGRLFLDGNSVAPSTKASNAAMLGQAGWHYMDLAIMAPIHPRGHRTPMLLSGEGADEVAAGLASQLAFAITAKGEQVGRASSIKMIRSIMVKGLEALTSELYEAGEKAGVLDEVLASLDASKVDRTWREQVDYNLERMTTHGIRRAEEMEEVVKTLEDLGLDPDMTSGTVRRQRRYGLAGQAPKKD